MTEKKKKVIDIVVNVIVSIIILMVIALTVNILVSGNKGYTPLFGNTYVAVQSESMDGDQPDSFKKGDMLKVKLLSNGEKEKLQVGDIITFYDNIQGQVRLNSHRIVEVVKTDEKTAFRTKGDNNAIEDSSYRTLEAVIGKVVGKAGGIGKAVLWLNSTAGFFVCVFTPSLIIVIYCIYNLVKVLLERNREITDDKKELLKQELLEQLRAEGKLADGVSADGAEQGAKDAEGAKNEGADGYTEPKASVSPDTKSE